jgi:transglutaminase-like putative cysteine protease
VSTLAPPPPPPPLPAEPLPEPPVARVASERGQQPPGAAPRPGRELVLALIAFAALAAFCAAHYAVLIEDTSTARLLGLVAVAALAGGALALTPRLSGGRPAQLAARLAVVAVAAGAALAVTGLRGKLLLPGHWDELGDGLARGFAGLDDFDWPYDGRSEWVRLTLRFAMPALVIPAALLAFWPARRFGGALRVAALAPLLALYGTGITESDAEGWALRGAVLLVLVAAWLWLPRLRPRDTGRAALMLGACCLLALPLAASLDPKDAWVDYNSWDWFENERTGSKFDWNHSYGPIEWSRTGAVLMNVKSPEAHYWKAETLDRFDGLRWFHSDSPFDRGTPARDIPPQIEADWNEHIEFTLRELRSSVVIGAGTTYNVEGGKFTSDEADGTVRVLDEPLAEGDSYEIDAYVPDPSADRMRAAPTAFPVHLLEYTAFDLPLPGESGLDPPDQSEQRGRDGNTIRTIQPLAPGVALTPADEERIRSSPYARTYALARQLSQGRETTYDTVKAVEAYLQRGFEYSEKPPARRYPLDAFLFDDRVGYCQQFSGAMALLLRMNGIPARVAAGFSPGGFNHVTKEYTVRDLDAHSWVEVWFTGIGWVPFDPTPSLAPASSQSNALENASAARGARADRGSTDPAGDRSTSTEAAPDLSTGRRGDEGKPWLLAVVIAALAAVAIGALWLSGAFRRRRHLHAQGAVDELREALRRLGHNYPRRMTLAQLEHRLRVTAGPGATRYVARLREQRYAPPGAGRAPTPRERRELRRALTAGRGPLVRLRGLLALPPHPRRSP